jgi:glutamyl-tRNA reductase
VDTLGVAYHPFETLEERARMLAELSVILAEVGSDHAVIGSIAVGYYGRLRATIDVDLLVPRDKLEALARALRARDYVHADTPHVQNDHDTPAPARPGRIIADTRGP